MMKAVNKRYDLSLMAGYTIVRLWYKNCNMNLILILRDKTNNDDSNVSFLKEVINYNFNQIEFKETRWDLHLPKFEIQTPENQKSLKQLLKVLGINDAFDEENANFQQMTEVNHKIYHCFFFICFKQSIYMQLQATL